MVIISIEIHSEVNHFLDTQPPGILIMHLCLNISIIASMKETLPNRVVGCSVCSWVACARSKHEKSRKEVGVRFQICAILKCHSSMFAS